MDGFLLKQKYASTGNLTHLYGKAFANSSVLCPTPYGGELYHKKNMLNYSFQDG